MSYFICNLHFADYRECARNGPVARTTATRHPVRRQGRSLAPRATRFRAARSQPPEPPVPSPNCPEPAGHRRFEFRPRPVRRRRHTPGRARDAAHNGILHTRAYGSSGRSRLPDRLLNISTKHANCHIWQIYVQNQIYMAIGMSSPSTRLALRSLGTNLKMARLKRRFPVKEFAERIGVSERTVARLEKGDDGVSVGTLAMACMVLGELHRISHFLDAGSDDIGLLMDRENLPKRIDRRRRTRTSSAPAGHDPARSGNDDDEGVGF